MPAELLIIHNRLWYRHYFFNLAQNLIVEIYEIYRCTRFGKRGC